MPIIRKINFMTNWNNKLCCYYFTTIRLIKNGNDKYYKPGYIFDLYIKNKFQFACELLKSSKIKGSQITDSLTLIDSGMHLMEFIEFCCKVYKIDKSQFAETKFLLLLFKRPKAI